VDKSFPSVQHVASWAGVCPGLRKLLVHITQSIGIPQPFAFHCYQQWPLFGCEAGSLEGILIIAQHHVAFQTAVGDQIRILLPCADTGKGTFVPPSYHNFVRWPNEKMSRFYVRTGRQTIDFYSL
jgi:hypothetical protein